MRNKMKYFIMISVFSLFLFTACGSKQNVNESLSSSKPDKQHLQPSKTKYPETLPTIPPQAFLYTENEKYELTLGTYTWSGVVVDAVGVETLLRDGQPIVVGKGEKIILYVACRKADECQLQMAKPEESEQEIKLSDYNFLAPKDKGIYYYSYANIWLQATAPKTVQAEANYAFVLEVK